LIIFGQQEAMARHRAALPKRKTGECRPFRGELILRARPDLHPESTSFELPREYRLTAATEDTAVCEVVDVGEPGFDKWGIADALPFKPGDIVLIPMGVIRQNILIIGEEHAVARAEDVFGTLSADGTVAPNTDYIITKRNPKRFAQALYGKDAKTIVPDSTLTDGIPSGEIRHMTCGMCGSHKAFPHDKPSEPVTRIVYEEVTHVGPGIKVYGIMRAPDITPGELVSFSVDLCTSFSVKGEKLRAVRFGHILVSHGV
jgi:co-chaperonin GroES (HSP10)